MMSQETHSLLIPLPQGNQGEQGARLTISWIKQTFLSNQHSILERWLLSSEQQNLSLGMIIEGKKNLNMEKQTSPLTEIPAQL